LGVSVAYISYICIRLSKFVSAKLNYNESGFTIEIANAIKKYRWSDIAKVKNYEKYKKFND